MSSWSITTEISQISERTSLLLQPIPLHSQKICISIIQRSPLLHCFELLYPLGQLFFPFSLSPDWGSDPTSNSYYPFSLPPCLPKKYIFSSSSFLLLLFFFLSLSLPCRLHCSQTSFAPSHPLPKTLLSHPLLNNTHWFNLQSIPVAAKQGCLGFEEGSCNTISRCRRNLFQTVLQGRHLSKNNNGISFSSLEVKHIRRSCSFMMKRNT